AGPPVARRAGRRYSTPCPLAPGATPPTPRRSGPRLTRAGLPWRSDAMNEERTPLPRPRCRSLMGVRVLGTGSYVPDAVVSTDHLHQRFGFDSDWIVKRTGIYERRHALPHQATSDLCYEAALRCLDSAGVAPRDIDLIVLATFTPDMSFPSTACLLQDRLKI